MDERTESQLLDQAMNLHRAGGFAEASELYREILSRDPRHGRALSLLGMLACQTDNWQEAVEFLSRAADVRPNDAEALNNLGTALRGMGRAKEAIAAYGRSLAAGETAQCRRNLSSILLILREPRLALEHAMRATELNAGFAEAHSDLAVALAELGQFAEAEQSARMALSLDPGLIPARNALASVLLETGDATGAEREAREGIQLNPDSADLLLVLARSLWKQSRLEEAETLFVRAAQVSPRRALAHVGLAGICFAQKRLADSETHAREAIAAEPDNSPAWNTLGNTLRDQGRTSEAIDAYRQSVQTWPANIGAHDNLCYTLHFSADQSPEQILAEHRAWSDRHESPLIPARPQYANSREPDRKLRIGYVSPDMREHPVGRMLLAVLKEHDRNSFEIACYSSTSRRDEITDQLTACADHWHEVAKLSHEQLARMIQEHRIDILVDLSLHMSENRLPVFARRPAPMQMSHMGYPATTGMRSIQYRFTDANLDPLSDDPPAGLEGLVRLPDCWWCYLKDDDAPPCGAPPAGQNGHVTFGSLNNPCKVSPGTMALWSRVLNAVPNSKLMLLVCERDGKSDYITSAFAKLGIAPQRLILCPQRPRRGYLELYQSIDVVLDMLPYNGHMSSCDAIWMGVPVVTLPGSVSVSRAGASILRTLALDEMVAATEDHFVAIASALATDLPRLAELRSALRGRMVDSPLCDSLKYAQATEHAYRQMWARWCAGGNPTAP